MRMNHIDIHVPDVAATTAFLVRHFGLTLREARGGNGLAILNDDAGLEIVVSHPVEKFSGAEQQALGVVTYHLGFIQPERTEVDRLIGNSRRAMPSWLGSHARCAVVISSIAWHPAG